MSGKRATRKSQGATESVAPPPSSATSSHKSVDNGGDPGANSSQSVMASQRQTRNHQRQAEDLTQSTLAEQEARRSSRATKGQHTKSFEQLEVPAASKKKGSGSKKSKKPEKDEKEEEEEDEEEVEDEEIIRCACGATTQDDDDPNEPWIACEECGAWQHNVCMGMSIFDDDLPKEYFCEQCRPDDHKELLAATAKGEKLWLSRRQKHEEETKKKKTKKGKKRISDTKDRSSPAASTTKSKASPAPEIKKEEDTTKGKRKSRDHSQGPASKLRKVTEVRSVPALPKYTPPADLAETIDSLEGTRKTKADGVRKSLDVALDLAVKSKLFKVAKETTKNAITERHAIEIERAVNDSHPNPTAAANQIRSLVFNLKKNVELAVRVFNRTLTAPALASMSSDEMQTEELQRKTAQMKELADKQAVLITEDGPRVRRTHKGEEVVENDTFMATEETPSAIRRQSIREVVAPVAATSVEQEENSVELPANIGPGPGPLRVDTTGRQQSPRQKNFDLDKVFSSVKSPSGPIQRRPSAPVPSAGPGVDADVDRMLEDDDGGDSPPYSPTENLDPDVVWQGHLKMTNLADTSIVAKFAGGADLKRLRGIDWKDLIPPLVTVAGRIPEDKAVPYLCGLRYNNQVDLVITRLAPANPSDLTAKNQYLSVINYFQSKQRYGVVGERQLGNVRDTYLIPLPAGDGPLPEILENIDGHLIPPFRPDPILLMVFVVRDEQIPISQAQAQTGLQHTIPTLPVQATPTPASDRKLSFPQPTWSPATPQGAFPPNGLSSQGQHQSHTPIPPPVIPGQPVQPVPQRPTPAVAPPAPVNPHDANALRQAQLEGEQKARQVLGPLFTSPTVTFLLPHAARMKEGEWNAVKRCIERDPRAREDLPLLSRLLTEEGNNAKQNGTSQPPASTASPGVVQNTIAAAQANIPSVPPPAQPKA